MFVATASRRLPSRDDGSSLVRLKRVFEGKPSEDVCTVYATEYPGNVGIGQCVIEEMCRTTVRLAAFTFNRPVLGKARSSVDLLAAHL